MVKMPEDLGTFPKRPYRLYPHTLPAARPPSPPRTPRIAPKFCGCLRQKPKSPSPKFHGHPTSPPPSRAVPSKYFPKRKFLKRPKNAGKLFQESESGKITQFIHLFLEVIPSPTSPSQEEARIVSKISSALKSSPVWFFFFFFFGGRTVTMTDSRSFQNEKYCTWTRKKKWSKLVQTSPGMNVSKQSKPAKSTNKL
jgi:hypothetical protein